MIEKKKKYDSRVKTRKWQSKVEMREFSKTYGQSEQKIEKSTTRKHLKPHRVPQSLLTPKNLNLLSKNFLHQIFESVTVGLDACQIAVDTPFCLGHLFLLNFYFWASSPFVSRFEFGPQTYSVILFILSSL